MKTLVYTLGIFVLLSQYACGTTQKYAASSLLQETRVHKEIALLPVQVAYEGPVPAYIKKEGLAAWQAAESKSLTRELYEGFMARREQNVMIALQKPTRTLALLVAAGIDLQNIEAYSPQALARILGVDALVSTQLAERRFYDEPKQLQRWASTEISHRSSPLREILKGHLKTASLHMTCALIEGEVGQAIWRYEMSRTATWDRASEEIIEEFQRKVARKFPYKK